MGFFVLESMCRYARVVLVGTYARSDRMFKIHVLSAADDGVTGRKIVRVLCAGGVQVEVRPGIRCPICSVRGCRRSLVACLRPHSPWIVWAASPGSRA